MEKEKITIEYCNDGIYYSDQGAWEWLYDLQNKILINGVREEHIKIASELMVELTRLLVIRKVIESDQIIYKYKGKLIPISSDGGLLYWPEGFCNNKEKVLDELIDFRYKLKERVESKNDTKICKQCEKSFDPEETQRVFGDLPLSVDCCSAICYTKFITSKQDE